MHQRDAPYSSLSRHPPPHLGRIAQRLKDNRHPSIPTRGAQWFRKQGDVHPLKAIGIVATIIVFESAMLVKEGWALLGFLER
jgi:hypothetical protein